MTMLQVIKGLAESLPALIDDERWSVFDYLPRQREAWHPPAVTIDSPTLLTVTSDRTSSATPMTCRLVAVASETDTLELSEALYAWADNSPDGLLRKLGALEHPAWMGTPQVTGVQIDDDFKISGQQTYRAAIVGLTILANNEGAA